MCVFLCIYIYILQAHPRASKSGWFRIHLTHYFIITSWFSSHSFWYYYTSPTNRFDIAHLLCRANFWSYLHLHLDWTQIGLILGTTLMFPNYAGNIASGLLIEHVSTYINLLSCDTIGFFVYQLMYLNICQLGH